MHCCCKIVKPLWKTVWWFLKTLKIKLPCDPAIPYVGIYPKELKAEPWRDICTLMFIVALLAYHNKPRGGSNQNVHGQMNG